MTALTANHDLDGTRLLLALMIVAAWLLCIIVGAVWLFVRAPSGWRATVRWSLIAGNLGGTGALLLAGLPIDPFSGLLCAVSLIVGVLLLVLRDRPARPAPPR